MIEADPVLLSEPAEVLMYDESYSVKTTEPLSAGAKGGGGFGGAGGKGGDSGGVGGGTGGDATYMLHADPVASTSIERS